MNAETIINGKRMVLNGAPSHIVVPVAPAFPATYWEADPLKALEPITIRTERHRLVRLTAEYEKEASSW